MLESIAKSKILTEKNKMNYKNLRFFLENSKERMKRIKAGTKLSTVIDIQRQNNKKVLLFNRISI